MSASLTVSIFVYFLGLAVETVFNRLTLKKFNRRISFTSWKAILILLLPLVDALLFRFNFPNIELGIVLVFFGVGLRIWAHFEWYCYLSNKLDTFLHDGPYRFLAHPMWAGLLISIFGIYVLAGSVIGLISFAFFWCPLAFKQLKKEESELADKFGEPYKVYLRSVPLKISRP